MKPALAVAGLILMLGGAHAQLCFDVFLENRDPFLQCADADYFIDGEGGGVGFTSFSGSDTGVLNADFDGFSIFDDPEIEVPGSIVGPFFSSVDASISTNPLGQATSIGTSHRGSVSMGPMASDFQSAAFQTRSRITFIAVNTADPLAPIELDIDIDIDFALTDPADNSTMGAALGGFGVKVDIGEPDLEPEFDISALAELDFDLDPLEEDLEFFGFDDPALDDDTVSFSGTLDPLDDDTFDIEIEMEIDIGDLDDDIDIASGDEITIETDTFGSIFTDGFESGDASVLKMSAPGTFTFIVSSPDPNVIFVLVPEPSTGALLLLTALCAAGRRRRKH